MEDVIFGCGVMKLIDILVWLGEKNELNIKISKYEFILQLAFSLLMNDFIVKE